MTKILGVSCTRRLRCWFGKCLAAAALLPAVAWAQTSTTTVLTSTANPSVYGQRIVIRATVTGNNPTGSVTFKDGAKSLGARALNVEGVAAYIDTTLSAGNHVITAVYSGDANNSVSSASAFAQNIAAAATTTTLTATPTSASRGQNVTLVARVDGPNPSGTVTFKAGGSAIGTASLIGGAASLGVTTLLPGSNSVGASYLGDTNHAASTSASVTVTVTARPAMTWQYGYDEMGRLNQVVDGNRQTTFTYYDKLGRLKQTAQPANTGTTELTRTDYEYNGIDDLTKVTDSAPRSLSTSYSRTGLGTVLAQSSPDTGTTTFTHDIKGRVLTSKDARGKISTIDYDGLDRVKSISYSTGAPTLFEYDGGASPTPAAKGELTKVTDESGHTQFVHDAMGRVIKKTVVIGARTFVVSYSWGDSGAGLDKLASITYPGGSRVNYSYDSSGFVNAIAVNPVDSDGGGTSTGSQSLLHTVTYNASNQVTGWTWAGGTPHTIGYDAFGQVISYGLGNPNGTVDSAGVLRKLTRDAGGRITAYTHTNNGTSVANLDQGFAYDKLDRLLAHTRSDTSYTYTYDATGNRVTKSVGPTTYTNVVSPTSNRLTQVSDALGTKTLDYDDAGNIRGDGSYTYNYSDRGRLQSVLRLGANSYTVSYTINGFGQRASKVGPSTVVSTGTLYYVYDEAGQLLGEYDINGAAVHESIYLGTMPVGVVKYPGSAAENTLVVRLYNVHADHNDTPRLITQRLTDRIVWRWDTAEAFGSTGPDQNPTAFGNFQFRQRFPGQSFDSETGNFQNWNRDYDPRTGRYVQPDPIGLAGGVNAYSYVVGDPVSYSDLEGLRPRGGNSYQRRQQQREEQAAERARLEKYFKDKAQQDAWMRSMQETEHRWERYGDGFGAITGGGEAIRNPGVPNAVEKWLDPLRKARGEAFVPLPKGPGPQSCPARDQAKSWM